MSSVYVLLMVDITLDYENTHTYVFDTKEKAREKLKELREDFETYSMTESFIVEENNKDYYCAYEYGRYVENHYMLKIEKKEIL